MLARIDDKQLEKVFCEYAKGIFSVRLPETEVIAIDGKTIRISNDRESKVVHVVSVWASTAAGDVCV
ncbi:hypothetical protein [Treponema brennaborense]|uniref:hypothetical protein n=1 Tax=Treponema brennaborense TaxID=81028 RepID=UPI0002EB5521|nr:hypothetical protein [Treponema brennaborense]